MAESPTLTIFHGQERLVSAPLQDVLTLLKSHQGNTSPPLFIFDDRTGRQVDFDLRGTLEDVLERHAPAPARAGPGRPKLGVVAREVTLLPRHWEWLEGQRSGASAALRRLIDEARKADPEGERRRLALNAVADFISVMAGNLPGYEEATRALFAGDAGALRERMQLWPPDIRTHALYLLAPAFADQP